MNDVEQTYESLDGFRLKGSFRPGDSLVGDSLSVLLVHGITADRNEGGFYTDLAGSLARNGVSSFRFDLRAHGLSEGKMEDLTLFGGVSDVAASRAQLQRHVEGKRGVILIAASFGGGLAVLHAAQQPPDALVLLNPNLDYAANWVGETRQRHQPISLPSEMARKLQTQGWVPRGEFHLSRAMMNEVIHVRPADYMSTLPCPTLTIHGNKDSMVSFDIARDNHKTAGASIFVSIDGADHGFIVPGDETLVDPQTAAYRMQVIDQVVSWIDNLS
jgi:pimeloyl-ACP methyl ester carboxylesterase